MQGRTIKGWNESGGRWMEISRRKRRMDAVGGVCTVSVGCAVYSLISSARKVLRGGRRGETLFSVIRRKKKTLSAQWCWVWIYVSVWGRVYNKCTHPLPFCKQKPVTPCWRRTGHWFCSFFSPLVSIKKSHSDQLKMFSDNHTCCCLNARAPSSTRSDFSSMSRRSFSVMRRRFLSANY